MAGIRRQKKIYSRPRKPFDKERILEENEVIKKYGLKNKKEIWKAEAQVKRLRNIAKGLITAPQEEQDAFIGRLVEKGFLAAGSQLDDVLDMKREDYLGRRLQTVVLNKKFAKSMKHSRQLITHRYVLIDGKIVNVPSYVVNLKEAKLIKVKPRKVKAEPKAVMQPVVEGGKNEPAKA